MTGEGQIDRQGGEDLNQDGIFRVPDERLYPQILLDFPEEILDLPAVFVNLGDGFGYQPKMVGQQFILRAAFGVTITDPSQAQRFPLVADLDDMVGSDAILASGRASLQQPTNGVSFQLGHKENAFRSKEAEPGITDVVLVKHRGEPLGSSRARQPGLRGRAPRKRWQRSGYSPHGRGRHIASRRPFCRMRPTEKATGQFDGCGVQAEQSGFETEPVPRDQRVAPCVHFSE